MPLYARDGGVWKSGGMPVKDGGVWKDPTQAYAKDGGVWKPVFASGPADVEFITSSANRTTLTTHNFSSVSFGDYESSRRIIVAVAAIISNSNGYLDAVSVGDDTATIVDQVIYSDVSQTFIVGFAIANPSGESGTVSVTLSHAATGCGIGVYRAINLKSETPFDIGKVDIGAGTVSTSVDVEDGGFVIAVVNCLAGGALNFSAGVTRDDIPQTIRFDMFGDSRYMMVGHAKELSAETSRTVSAGSSISGAQIIAASWS